MNKDSLKNLLILDEGLKLLPYTDTVGKITIGCGRNLTDVGISSIEANMLLDNDLNRVINECFDNFPWFNQLCDARQNVIASLTFNLGLEGIKAFSKMLAAVAAKNYDEAANQMLLSKWAGQVGARATRLAEMMRDGSVFH